MAKFSEDTKEIKNVKKHNAGPKLAKKSLAKKTSLNKVAKSKISSLASLENWRIKDQAGLRITLERIKQVRPPLSQPSSFSMPSVA